MEDIGQQQFLMLLLVMAAELDQRPRRLGRQIGQRLDQRGIDMGAIGADLVERRPRQHAARCARVALALGLVIAVEQKREALVVTADSRGT